MMVTPEERSAIYAAITQPSPMTAARKRSAGATVTSLTSDDALVGSKGEGERFTMEEEVKVCKWCFEEFTQHHGEPSKRFEVREYCGRSCAAKGSHAKINPRVFRTHKRAVSIIPMDRYQITAEVGK